MLRIRGLEAGYGARPVLRGIDLLVGPGEVVALVGPNGCGKTTLLRAATKVVPWTAGEVYAGEAPVRGMSPRELARCIAIVPQNPVLPAGYTALEVVLMGRTPHLSFFDQEGAADLRIAESALSRAGVADLAARPVDELSGGERQSVILARALAQQAPVLLLDEPTANLDIAHQMATARLVRELAGEGLAVLAAVHDLTLASLYSDRVVLMREGRIAAEGAPDAVLTPDNLREVYGTEVTVLGHAGRPVVVPLTPEA